MELEPPRALLGRLKIGREEFCQRLLTMLILESPYPRWNSRSVPSRAGLRFLRALHDASFGEDWPGDTALFVDEFEMKPRHDDEAGAGPDYAMLWDKQVWLIELKTEKASHRPGQIPAYFDLAHHYYPDAKINLLYVTPPVDAPHVPPAPWGGYAHTTWADLAPLIRWNWPPAAYPSCQALADGLLETIDNLHLKPPEWRTLFLGSLPDTPEAVTTTVEEDIEQTRDDPVGRAMELAGLTAEDGQQRALDFMPADLDDLLQVRLAVRDLLANSPAASPLRHIQPWIWRPESTGQPMTPLGREFGRELRISRNERPLY